MLQDTVTSLTDGIDTVTFLTDQCYLTQLHHWRVVLLNIFSLMQYHDVPPPPLDFPATFKYDRHCIFSSFS